MSVQEIEAAIKQLPPEEVAALTAWLAEYHAELWDRQLEDDLEEGRLDTVLAEVEKEYEQGLARRL